MTPLDKYTVSVILLASGIPLTYAGYKGGLDSSGDDNPALITLMSFGILFIILSIVFLGLTIKNKF